MMIATEVPAETVLPALAKLAAYLCAVGWDADAYVHGGSHCLDALMRESATDMSTRHEIRIETACPDDLNLTEVIWMLECALRGEG